MHKHRRQQRPDLATRPFEYHPPASRIPPQHRSDPSSNDLHLPSSFTLFHAFPAPLSPTPSTTTSPTPPPPLFLPPCQLLGATRPTGGLHRMRGCGASPALSHAKSNPANYMRYTDTAAGHHEYSSRALLLTQSASTAQTSARMLTKTRTHTHTHTHTPHQVLSRTFRIGGPPRSTYECKGTAERHPSMQYTSHHWTTVVIVYVKPLGRSCMKDTLNDSLHKVSVENGANVSADAQATDNTCQVRRLPWPILPHRRPPTPPNPPPAPALCQTGTGKPHPPPTGLANRSPAAQRVGSLTFVGRQRLGNKPQDDSSQSQFKLAPLISIH